LVSMVVRSQSSHGRRPMPSAQAPTDPQAAFYLRL